MSRLTVVEVGHRWRYRRERRVVEAASLAGAKWRTRSSRSSGRSDRRSAAAAAIVVVGVVATCCTAVGEVKSESVSRE